VTADRIRTLDDIRRLPFTTREDLQESYPLGLLAVPRERIVRLHSSSGTTGKPKVIVFTRNDIARATENIARCLVMTGMGPGDVLQNMMTYGLFTGGLILHYGAERIGAMVIPSGPGNTERQILLMRDFETTSVHMTPSYAIYLANAMEKQGIDPRSLSLKRAFIGAEPYSEATRRKIERIFGIDVFNSYGLTEMSGPGVAFECLEKDGMHVWEDSYFMEIVDPQTGEPVPDGEEGELVLSTLHREAMPILRYRTRDITSIMTAPCPCDRTHRRLARITGRSDDMFILRGVNIYPQQIERVLMKTPGVAMNYYIHLDGLDMMTIKVEMARDLFDGDLDRVKGIVKSITDRLKSEILVSAKVELVEPGSLPASEGKTKRVIDTRKI
jgi:phenylacetate-CoA ligase